MTVLTESELKIYTARPRRFFGYVGRKTDCVLTCINSNSFVVRLDSLNLASLESRYLGIKRVKKVAASLKMFESS